MWGFDLWEWVLGRGVAVQLLWLGIDLAWGRVYGDNAGGGMEINFRWVLMGVLNGFFFDFFVGFFAWWWWVCCCRGGVSGCGGKCGFHLFGFLPWGGGVAMGFGLGMLFVVVVVVAKGCRFGFLFLFGF